MSEPLKLANISYIESKISVFSNIFVQMKLVKSHFVIFLQILFLGIIFPNVWTKLPRFTLVCRQFTIGCIGFSEEQTNPNINLMDWVPKINSQTLLYELICHF